MLKDTNRLAEAEPLMRQAVKIFEQSLGTNHPRTQKARENLEILLSEITGGQERPEPDSGAA